MSRLRLATIICVTVGAAAVAQDTPRAEIYGDYTYMQYNPTITGLQSRALNGAGGGFQINMGKYFGLKGDLQGYQSTQWTLNVTSPITTPNGTIIPVGTYKTNANMFTYLFGPVIQVPAKRVKPFAEVLFGGSNTNLYGRLYNQTITGGQSSEASGTQHPFTMAMGGGLDVSVNKHVAFRLAELDYVMTRYTNPFTNTNNQNSFRYLGGIVFKFGGERIPPPPPAPKTKACPGGTSIPIDQECPKKDIGLGLRSDNAQVCAGSAVTVRPAMALPEGATLNWSVNGESISQAPTLEFGTTGRPTGAYKVGLKVTAPGYNDASAETNVTVLAYAPPSGSVQVSPNEIWAGEKARIAANFRPGQCGGNLAQPTFAATEGSVSGTEYDSSGVQFDPSNTSEQRKTITIAANVSDGTGSGSANGTLVVKKKGAVVAKRLPDIIFPANSARVNNCGKRVLLETLKTMTDGDPTATVVLVGHQTEAEAKHAGLDQKRALEAAAVLSAGKGICASVPASQIQVSAVGATDNGVDYQPQFCGTSAQERAGQSVRESDQNAKYRRVEVWFVPTGATPPASVRDSKDAASLPVSSLGCPK